MTKVFTERVLFKDKVAVNKVEVLANGKRHKLFSEIRGITLRWLIQSPNSPGLRDGPAPVLKRCGVEIIAESPNVGKNLQDHYQMRTVVEMVSNNSLNKQIRNPVNWQKWVLAGR